MFTGLIEELGTLTRIQPIAGGKRLRLTARKILDDLNVDDSVAVNGICLTVNRLESDGFWADAVGDTLDKTTLKSWHEGNRVNLERALRLSDRLGGHLVQGHVNGIARITRLDKLGENYFLEIEIPASLQKYMIGEGSIAVDGISFTIARINGLRIGISVIPHTWNLTVLGHRKNGDQVNVEVDVIAKYVERLLGQSASSEGGTFSDNWLKKMGY